MLHHLTNSINLNHQYQYQLIFIISMIIYHSNQYFIVDNLSHPQQGFFLTFFNHLNNSFLQITLISITVVIIILIAVKTCIQKQQNPMVQIMQKIVYPIQIYILVKVIKQNNQKQQNRSNILSNKIFVTFLASIIINSILIIVENYNINLRYSNIFKFNNRIFKQQYFILIIKIFINAIFSIFFDKELEIYIVTIIAINLLINILFYSKIIYEHPKTQLLYLITQFYLWMPVSSLIFIHFNITSKNALLLFGIITTFIYISICLLKPKILVSLLEKKYQKCFQKVNLKNIKLHQANQSIINLISILSISLQLFFQQSSQKLQWSDSFKANLMQFIKQKTFSSQNKTINQLKTMKMSTKTISLQQITNKNISNEAGYQSSQNIFTKSISKPKNTIITNKIKDIKLTTLIESNQNTNCVQNKQLLYELLWQITYPYLVSKTSQSKRLRFYVCYNFPDSAKYMKYRLFGAYYLNCFEKYNFLDRIQSGICNNYLLRRIGSHSQFHRSFNINKYIQNQLQIDCLNRQQSYYHPKYNDVLKQQQLNRLIIEQLQKFIINQKLYIQIIKTIKELKQNIRLYYKKRRQIRIRLQSLIIDYDNLKIKNQYFIIIINYIHDYYINKTPFQAKQNLQKSFENILQLGKHINNNSNKSYSSINNKIIHSFHNDFNSDSSNDKSIQKMYCIISGLKQIGKIFIASPKFINLMEIQKSQKNNTNNNQSTQNYSIQMINDFIPSIWRDKHVQIMRQIQYFQKPIHHINNNNYLISKKQNNLIQVKFKMYFFLLFQKDFLIVLDFRDQTKLSTLIVKDQNKNIVFQYKSNKNYSQQNKSQENKQNKHQQQNKNLVNKTKKYVNNQQKNIEDKNQQQLVQIFDNMYYIQSKQLFKQNSHYNIQEFSLKKKLLSYQKVSFKQSNQILIQSIFQKYKLNFNIYTQKYIIIKSFVLLSIIFYWLIFQNWIVMENSSRNTLLTLINDKMFLQNKFIAFDQFTTIDTGILYDIVKDVIHFDNQQQKQLFLTQSLISVSVLKNQILKKYSVDSFATRKSSLTDFIFNPNLVQGYNISFMVHGLFKQVQYFSLLQIFIDLPALEQFRPLSTYQYRNTSLINQINITIPHVNLPKQLKPQEQGMISELMFDTGVTKTYHFGKDGVLDKLQILQNQLVNQVVSSRNFYFMSLQIVFAIFTILIVSCIIEMKKSILQNYNNSIRVSDQFIKNFQSQTIKLANTLILIKNNSINSAQSTNIYQITQNTQNKTKIRSRKSTNHTKSQQTIKTIKQKLTKNENKFQNSKLNLSKYLFESILFPFLRYFVVAFTLFAIQQQVAQKSEVMKRYSSVITQYQILNTNIVQGYGMNLWKAKAQYDHIPQQMLAQLFIACIKQAQQLDKINIIENMFPFNKQIQYSILYEKGVDTANLLNISSGYFKSLNSLLQESNYLLLNYQKLYFHQTMLGFNRTYLKQHFTQLYHRMNEFVFLSDKISQVSFRLLKGNIDANYDYDNYLIGVLIFLVFQIIMVINHFNEILFQFYDEYLNIGTVDQLRKQQGFDTFVNLALTDTAINQFQSNSNKKSFI